MRVLFVYPTLFPELAGGIEARNRELAATLARRGHRVALAACTSMPGDALPEGIEILRLGPFRPLYGKHGRRSTRAAIGFARDCARLSVAAFDVIETASAPYTHLPLLAGRCRRAGRPLLVSWYEYWGAYWRTYLRGPQWPLYAIAEWSTARLGRRALASSELTLARLVRRRGESSTRLLHCGIRVAAVREAAAEAPPGPPLIYAGRLLREKRLDLLLAALDRVPAPTGPLLTVIGDGPDRGRLEDLAHRRGLTSRVIFRGRLPDHASVWRAIGGARIALQPSSREGFGLFPLEAMAAGLPVIHCLSSESAVPELVRDGREGLGVEPSEERLAGAISELLASPERCRRLGEAGRLRAADFDWDAIAAQFESLAAEAAGARPRS